jgi:hypothetical protein
MSYFMSYENTCSFRIQMVHSGSSVLERAFFVASRETTLVAFMDLSFEIAQKKTQDSVNPHNIIAIGLLPLRVDPPWLVIRLLVGISTSWSDMLWQSVHCLGNQAISVDLARREP